MPAEDKKKLRGNRLKGALFRLCVMARTKGALMKPKSRLPPASQRLNCDGGRLT